MNEFGLKVRRFSGAHYPYNPGALIGNKERLSNV